MAKKKLKEPSEGETFIGEYFDSKGITYKREHIIYPEGDKKSHRSVDFYLPIFDVCVEFFGLWNRSEQDRERYRQKKRIYEANNIKCVYLYPENLGIIRFLFKRRLLVELKKSKKIIPKLYYLYWSYFLEGEKYLLTGVIVLLTYLSVTRDLFGLDKYLSYGFLILLLLVIVNDFYDVFKHSKNPKGK